MYYTKERKPENGDTITIGLTELMARLNTGRPTAERIAVAAGAKIKIGKRTLYHVGKIESYLEQLADQQKA
ncbi:MAG: hypothetical protein K6G34_06225 [Lachnospiraceae bacterium]|nr:hypothetical protein [Lachnospiraceae bacterium]